jgi:hypothetical protein
MSNGPVQPCSSVGQPGTEVTLPTPIPNNVTVVLTGYVQTGAVITVSVVSNTTGNAVATLSGTGVSPTAMTTSSKSTITSFNSGTDTFYITVTSTYGGKSNPTASVILQDMNLTYGATAYAGCYAFVAEDNPVSGDCDFNDCTCYLTWNLFSG